MTLPQNTTNSDKSHSRLHPWLKIFLYIGLIAVIIGVAYRFYGVFSSTSEHSHYVVEQPVAATIVKKSHLPVILTELGTVVPISNVTVQTRISGYLQQVFFTEGQLVKKNDLLALIDPRPSEALKAQYEGNLKADTALLQQAKLDNKRYQTLLKQNSIAPMTAQDQQYKVAQLEGQVKTDQALIKQQELNLIYCHIRAPVDGRIGIRQVDAGNYITEGQSGGLATLTQMTPMSVIFTLPENQLGIVLEALKNKKELTVEAWNTDNTTKLATGKTSVIDSQIDTSTGTVRLRAIFENKNWELFPNQFVNAHLLVKIIKDALILPNNAIQTGPNGSFVYVIQKDSTVKIQTIKTGYNDGEHTVITTGLVENEKIVTDGIDTLHEGSKVIIPENTQSSE